MRRLRDRGAGGVKGWCLRTVRTAWHLAPDERSAIQEWESIPEKHKRRQWWRAPKGAPHFWSVGEFGHVAIQAAVPGWCWSVDAPNVDRVGLVRLAFFRKRWGAKYLGWSVELNNHRLPIKG